MPWDRKRLLGYVETIQFILGVPDKTEEVSSNLSIIYFYLFFSYKMFGFTKNTRKLRFMFIAYENGICYIISTRGHTAVASKASM